MAQYGIIFLTLWVNHSTKHLATFPLEFTSIGSTLTATKRPQKHKSVGVILLFCLSLPASHQYQLQNIFFVALTPGPSEPTVLQMNHVLGPLEHLQRPRYPGAAVELWQPARLFQGPAVWQHNLREVPGVGPSPHDPPALAAPQQPAIHPSSQLHKSGPPSVDSTQLEHINTIKIMSENTLDPMLDFLGSGNPPSASPVPPQEKERLIPNQLQTQFQRRTGRLKRTRRSVLPGWKQLETRLSETVRRATPFGSESMKYYADLVEKVNKEKKNVKSFNQIAIRSVGSVECRWGHILKFVNKFIGFYSQCADQLKSGQTRDQILSEAMEMFKNQCKMHYNLDHCYVLLKDAPKFQMARDGVNTRETKAKTPKPKTTHTAPNTPSTSANGASSPVTIDIENEETSELSTLGNERMEGQKAAKKKRADDQSMGKIVHMQKELVQISRERLETMKSALQDASDEAILSKDLDSMSGQKRRYYERKLQLIFDREDALEKKQKEEEEKKKIEIEKANDNNLEDKAGIECE
ncbi:hypothetical protein PSTG_00850 [Puccinia striiformis f. sp. tritici PST-78]|uniref:No apical meristem-associated C-terminal domain-containing protein n=1 Tax=Puccinia striiformis f. sp. tritici PST-78 TaxID=1165861 RepID=A0A0L0W2X2_9BASI|nr:hypothetical protein PSTG_00850 [Puccinia striiformis f. sp. tritici PST-78]